MMAKQMKVDVEKSLGYQANGRLKPSDRSESASFIAKNFVCPDCGHEKKATKKEFGEGLKCEKCGQIMTQNM
jgi:transcription elongation factor Elf1